MLKLLFVLNKNIKLYILHIRRVYFNSSFFIKKQNVNNVNIVDKRVALGKLGGCIRKIKGLHWEN